MVKEVIVGGGVDGAHLGGVGIGVEHDVEAEAEGQDEEGVPEQEEEEGLENPVEMMCESGNDPIMYVVCFSGTCRTW